MLIALYIFSYFCIFATLISLSKSVKWWIRAFDFPFAQLTLMTLAAILCLATFASFGNFFEYFTLIFLFSIFVYQLVIVVPYTPLYPCQVQNYKNDTNKSSIKILSSNVLMTNKETSKLKELIARENPDVIVLLETDEYWKESMSYLTGEYTHHVLIPIENTYGLLLYSRFLLDQTDINYLVEVDVPSINTLVQFPNGKQIRMVVTHPPPPSPTEYAESAERDGELLIIGKMICDEKFPVIVVGDLNDVAWSHTTRLFQRTANLLDPRIGRGFFNTFHVSYPFLRWPLDHVFHSAHFRVVSMQRLENIGSDHFPICIELNLEPDARRHQSSDDATKEDRIEVKEKIDYAINTPSSKID